MARITFIAFLLLAILGCFEEDLCICTDEFVSIRFSVVDGEGNTVPSIPVRVQIARSGEVVEVDQDWAREGIYKVVDDSHKGLIRFFSERFIVTGAQGAREFSAEYVIDVGRDCRCHVRKLSGPETVLLE